MAAPRRLIGDPIERVLRTVQRMSLGTMAGRVESAAPVARQKVGPKLPPTPPGGLQMGDQAGDVAVSDSYSISLTGSGYTSSSVPITFTGPPAWLDNTGHTSVWNLMKNGIYCSTSYLRNGTSGFVAGDFIRMGLPLSNGFVDEGGAIYPADQVETFGHAATVTDELLLSEDVIDWPVNPGLYINSAQTLTVNFWLVIQRLAFVP